MTGLDSEVTPGIHRVLTPAAEAAAVLDAQGWRAVVVPSAPTTEAFYAGLASALGLPDWFGANLDALWDCLADLPGPTVLVLESWQNYARREPEVWRRILGVLAERTGQPPPFAVLLA